MLYLAALKAAEDEALLDAGPVHVTPANMQPAQQPDHHTDANGDGMQGGGDDVLSRSVPLSRGWALFTSKKLSRSKKLSLHQACTLSSVCPFLTCCYVLAHSVVLLTGSSEGPGSPWSSPPSANCPITTVAGCACR